MERAILNLHTKMSMLEGVVDVKEYIEKVKELGITTIGITDIESVKAFADIYNIKEYIMENHIKILYGTQLKIYSNFNRLSITPEIHIYAKNKAGLRNLYILLSEAKQNKRLDFESEIFVKYRQDLMIGSGSKNGEIYLGYLFKYEDDEIEKVANQYDFLEIQPSYGREINEKIIELGKKLNKLVIASEDIYYLDDNDYISRKILKCYYNNCDNESTEIKNVSKVGLLKTTKEVVKEFNYLGQDKVYEVVVDNTNRLAKMCEEFDILPEKRIYPQFAEAKDIMNKVSKKRLNELYGENISPQILNRYEYELKTIYDNNFEGIYYLAYLIAKKATQDNERFILRGSGSSSLIAYLLGISYIDPIKYHIPIETFSKFNGDFEPDFDFNFRPTYNEKIHEFIMDMFGKEKVVYAGTTGTIIDSTACQLDIRFCNENNIVQYYNHSQVIKNMIGTFRSTQEHPGGLIIMNNNEDIFDYTPVEYLKYNDKFCHKVTHLSYHFLMLNLLKIDLLNYEGLELLKKLEEKTGVTCDKVHISDDKIYKLFEEDENGNINTDGLIEFNTEFAKELIRKIKPKTIEDLIKIDALLHGTNVWKDNVEYLIEEHKLSDIACSRDDIFLYLLEKGISRENAFKIMEFVRKGSARKIEDLKGERKNYYLEKWNQYKDMMQKANIPDWYIHSLEKIRYIIPKAYSCNYTVLALTLAWYKVHYSKEFKETYGTLNG